MADRLTPEERARMLLMQHDFDWETFDGITELPEWPPPLNDLADAIASAIRSAVSENNEAWRPIETAPRGRVPILIAYDGGEVELVENSSVYDWVPYVGSDSCDTPYAWMPLPKPPPIRSREAAHDTE